MPRSPLVLLLVLAPLPGQESRPALPPHPRLLLSAAEVPALREKIRRVAWAGRIYAGLKKEADGWLGQAVVLPPRGGQWSHWYACRKDGARLQTEAPDRHRCPVCGEVYSGWPWDDVLLNREHHRLAGAARTLGLVFQVEGGERYAAKAKEILLAYAVRYRSYPLHNIRGKAAVGGGRVGPQTLDESVLLIPVCQGADLVWDHLDPAERKTIEEGLLRPAVAVIRAHRLKIHNIQCWKNSAVGLAGLLLGDPELVADAVDSAHGYAAQIAEGVTADGTWWEGAWGYHFYTLSALLPLAEAGERCGLGLYGLKKGGRGVEDLCRAPLAFAAPGLVLPAFSDSREARVQEAARSYELALARYRDPAFAAPLAGGRREGLEALVMGVEPLPGLPAIGGGSRLFPAAGVAVLHAGEEAGALWACLRFGPHGGGHGHPDKLSFVTYANGRNLAFDPGTAPYGVPLQGEWYRTTLAHNTLVVDESNQAPAEGRCLAFAAGPGLAAVLAEAGPIYPGVRFRRALAVAGGDLLLVLDRVEAQEEHLLALACHHAGAWGAPPAGEAAAPAAAPGYRHLRDLVRVAGPLPEIRLGEGRAAALAVASPEPVAVLAGTGVGSHAADRIPAVIVRHRGRELLVGWALRLGGPAPALTARAEAGGWTLAAGEGGARLRIGAEGEPPLLVQAAGRRLEGRPPEEGAR